MNAYIKALVPASIGLTCVLLGLAIRNTELVYAGTGALISAAAVYGAPANR